MSKLTKKELVYIKEEFNHIKNKINFFLRDKNKLSDISKEGMLKIKENITEEELHILLEDIFINLTKHSPVDSTEYKDLVIYDEMLMLFVDFLKLLKFKGMKRSAFDLFFTKCNDIYQLIHNYFDEETERFFKKRMMSYKLEMYIIGNNRKIKFFKNEKQEFKKLVVRKKAIDDLLIDLPQNIIDIIHDFIIID